MTLQYLQPLWFALQVAGRKEKNVAEALAQKGYEVFLPLYKVRRRRSDRVVNLELPLFPGYLFCRFSSQKRLPILITPGVILLIGSGGAPVPVDEAEIAAVRAIVNSGRSVEPWPALAVGQRVRVEGCSLAGLEGTLLEIKNSCRLIISVTLIQRSVAVEIDRNKVRPIEAPREIIREACRR
jgi:transcription antitermination factor NusG